MNAVRSWRRAKERRIRRRRGQDCAKWQAHLRLDKYEGEVTAAQIDAGEAPAPYETIERDGNLLLIGGVSALWQFAVGNGTTTADQELSYYSNARATIGVGDSSTAAADTQTALQAATNRLYKAMDATYPLHTDSDSSGAAKTITFRSTFGTGDANFAWQEWGIFNSTTHNTGRGLNRKVESLGTKTSAATWVLTITLTIA